MNSNLSKSRLKLISYTTMIASIVLGCAGQLLMKNAMMNQNGELLSWTFLQNLALAITTYSLGVVNWICALRFIKLSIAYPLTSLNYVGIIVGSHYFFNEEITINRVSGVCLIFIGVMLVVIPIKTPKAIQKNAD